MFTQKIILQIRKDLKKNVDVKYREGSINFFKEPIECWGVRNPIVKKLEQKYWQEIKNWHKKDIFWLCEELLKSNYNEEAGMAFEFLWRIRQTFVKNDFKIFVLWLKRYINNWAKCDDFCTHAFGYVLYNYPEFLVQVKKWTKSKNRWERRASAVIMIYPTRKDKKFLVHNFAIAGTLLTDSDDLVQKGYGWMLKVASDNYLEPVFEFVMKRKAKMSRTALRYAIEKMPDKLKNKVMAR
ncbi:MAG TPA: DNA alkylation repair protein [Candidatus Magasanikbacteria bacterium]|nr:DNA alkylation repair protein [Candidatus Magasanikbacteria bacterium]